MYCSNCGERIPDNSKFCGVCGSPCPEVKKTFYVEEPNDISDYLNEGIPTEKPKKKKVFFKLAAVLIACILVFSGFRFLWPYISNAAMRLASPEKHQAFVYKRSCENIAELMCGSMIEDGRAIKGTASIEIGDVLYEAVEDENTEADLEELEKVTVDYEFSVKDEMYKLVAKGTHPEIELNCEAVVDVKDEEMTLLLPELNDDAVELDYDNSSGIFSLMTNSSDKKTFKKLVGKYAEAYLLEFDDVKREKDSYEVNGERVNALCFKVSVTEEMLIDALIEVLEMAAEDKELEDFFDDVLLPNAGVDEDFDDLIEELIDELKDENFDDEEEIDISTYINGKGEIIAFIMEVDDETIKIASYSKGNKLGFEMLKEDSDREDYRLSCEGTKSFGKINLDIICENNEEEVYEIKVKDLKLGKLKKQGKITIKQADSEYTNSSLYEDREIVIDFSMTGRSYDLSYTLSCSDGDVLKLKLEGKFKKAGKIELHPDPEKDEDEWEDDLDEGVIEDLEDIFGTFNRTVKVETASPVEPEIYYDSDTYDYYYDTEPYEYYYDTEPYYYDYDSGVYYENY